MGISVDVEADSKALAERLGVGFPLLSDPGAAVAVAYGVAMKGQDLAVPAVFVVRSDRRVHWKYVGKRAADRPPLEQVLEQLDAALADP